MKNEAVQYGFRGPYSLLLAQKSRKESDIKYWSYSMDLHSPYGSVFGIEFEEDTSTVHRPYSTDFYSPYSLFTA
jgi:hypothetical protein